MANTHTHPTKQGEYNPHVDTDPGPATQQDEPEDLLDMVEPCDLEAEAASEYDIDEDGTYDVFEKDDLIKDKARLEVSVSNPPETRPKPVRRSSATPIASSMQRLNNAIEEFEKNMREGDEEATCYLMIGIFYINKNMAGSAIRFLRQGLHVKDITMQETTALLFQLGHAYDQLQDSSEAVYYYKRVHSINPNYQNVEQRLHHLTSTDPGSGSLTQRDSREGALAENR